MTYSSNTPKADLIQVPNPNSYDEYVSAVRRDVERIFGATNPDTARNLATFIENGDHGAKHSFNVYSKAMEIAAGLKDVEIDESLIYLMATSHDSGRFHISENSKKQGKCERRHDFCGVAQIRLGTRKIKENEGVQLGDSDYEKLVDYVKNHDYFNERLDGEQYKEPTSIEGQIVRLADRMSTDIKEEVQRYWETGKRLKTKYFIKGVPLEDRINFSFRKVKEYILAEKFDEFTFFLALISMSPNDFANPQLSEIYSEWAKTKGQAIEEIIRIGKDEGYSEEDVNEMRKLIIDYTQHFGIKIESI